jgi:protein-disulfide isomerase
MSHGVAAGSFKPVLLIAIALAYLPPSHAQDAQQVTAAGQQSILSKPGIETAGAHNADVTVVEYFDYNCPFCKKIAPTLQMLIAKDRKIAILYKEWPILGEVSVYAARSALAAQWQGKYLLAHDALMSGPRLAKDDQVDSTLSRAGVNLDVLVKDRARHSQEITDLLTRNDKEAYALGIQGTPGILVGRLLVPGSVDLNDLQELVARSRRKN